MFVLRLVILLSIFPSILFKSLETFAASHHRLTIFVKMGSGHESIYILQSQFYSQANLETRNSLFHPFGIIRREPLNIFKKQIDMLHLKHRLVSGY